MISVSMFVTYLFIYYYSLYICIHQILVALQTYRHEKAQLTLLTTGSDISSPRNETNLHAP